MEKKNNSGARKPLMKRQAAKSLSGHVRARSRGTSRALSAIQHGAQLMMW